MSEIMESSRLQNLDLQLQTLGPFFRITAKILESGKELGRAKEVIRVWFGGKIMHLDSMKLQKETIGMKKSIFGIGLFLGAVAIRFGYDCGCSKAELLAINDTNLYHSKVIYYPFFSSLDYLFSLFTSDVIKIAACEILQEARVQRSVPSRRRIFERFG